MTAFLANANMLILTGLTSVVDGVLADAPVQVTIKDGAGVTMSGTGWPTFPADMEPVSSVPGDYQLIFATTVPWTANKTYKAIIEVPNVAHWEHSFRPAVRKSS